MSYNAGTTFTPDIFSLITDALCSAFILEVLFASVSLFIELCISFIIVATCPSASPCMAASTAPQWVCPSTTTRGHPRCPTAYSMLPSSFGPIVFPAVLITNRLPIPAENIASGITLEYNPHFLFSASQGCPARHCYSSFLLSFLTINLEINLHFSLID